MADEKPSERGPGGRHRVHRETRLERKRHRAAPERRATTPAEGEQTTGAEDEPTTAAPRSEERAAEEQPAAREEQPAAREQQQPAAGEEPERGAEEPEEEQRPRADQPDDGRRRGRVGVADIARIARAQLQELIGRQVTAVVGVERRNDGDWEVQVETVELQRVPDTTSIMGLYEVILDHDGEFLEFRRMRRYHRTRPDEDGA